MSDRRPCATVKVADLKDRMKVDQIDLEIRTKSDPRTVNSRTGEALKVCDCAAVDPDGAEITLTLWNQEIDGVNAGDKVRVTNGWVASYKNKLQLSAGRFGKLEKLG